MEDLFAARLKYLRNWWEEHGSRSYLNADDWIDNMSNTELLHTLSWAKED